MKYMIIKWNTISIQLTSWVMTAILQQDSIQGRTATIELFIKVASECLKYHDAQSCVLITCALNSCCVRHDRLKLSWEQVSGKVIIDCMSMINCYYHCCCVCSYGRSLINWWNFLILIVDVVLWGHTLRSELP